MANLLDHIRVAACGSAWVTTKEREDEFLRRVEFEKRIAALEVARLGRGRPLAVLENDQVAAGEDLAFSLS